MRRMSAEDSKDQRIRRLAREVTLAEERQRRVIARGLHDHLGQALAFIRMQITALQGDLVFSGAEDRLDVIRDLLDRSIRYTRTLTAEISPPVLYELGLLPAVEWLADELRRKHDLPARVRSEGDLETRGEATRVMLFITVRELLVNAAKHAHAEQVEVHMVGDADSIQVEVRDDGVGFDPSEGARHDGFGLFSVAERIRSMGGDVEIDAAPGRGTRIRVSVPRGEETR
jgi:signal transduction histidine kinase